MARFDSIKQTIDSNIKSNGNQEITGQKLNSVLNGMMSSVDAALTEVENAIPEEIVPPVGGEKELMQVYLGDTLTTEQKAANVEVFNALAEGKGIIPYALYSSNIPMPFTNMIKWTVSGVADHFTLKSYNLDTLAEGKCSVVAVVINSDGTTSSSQSDITLPTGEGAGNSVEAAILEFNSSGLALSAEQKAHNAEIYQKIFNNETVQVYLNVGALVPLQYSSISGTEIILSASAIITSEPSSLRYQSIKLSSDGDVQMYEQKEYPLGGSSEGGVAELMVSTTYADLVALRDAGNLVPGMKYRITDYETITTKEGSQSAGHPFDIIVTALDNKTISENASAIQSARDTNGYFKQANLKAWQLKYALDNLDGRFDFVPQDSPAYINVSITANGMTLPMRLIATGIKDIINEKECYIFVDIDYGARVASESEDLQAGGSILIDADSILTGTINSVENVPGVYNSKGVIYRMIDAQGNSCPYDFKNIKFLRTDTEDAETYEYTFSYKRASGRIDYSVSNPDKCYDNFMADGCWDNVFVFMLQFRISGNKFGDGCTSNTFGEETYNVILGAECKNNTLAGYNNGCVFGNKCTYNNLGNTSSNCIFGSICIQNELGAGCAHNTFGDNCQRNTLGVNCIYNTFGKRCTANVLGDECRDNHFGSYCTQNEMGSYSLSNSFGNECTKIRFTKSSPVLLRDYNRYNVVDNGCKSVNIYGVETPSEESQIQNVHIYSGIQGETSSPVGVEIPATGNAYSYSVARNSDGELKVYVEADLVQ